MDGHEIVFDMRDRLERGIDELDRLKQRAAASHNMTEYTRLNGKIEGLKVAFDMLRSYP